MLPRNILYFVFPVLVLAQRPPYGRPLFPHPQRRNYYRPTTPPLPGVINECGNSELVCVKKEDCSKDLDGSGVLDGHPCPPFYVYDTVVEYCVNIDIAEKDNLDAVEICESQGGELLHFENGLEFQKIVDALSATPPVPVFIEDGKMYWLDAYYDDKRETWIRRTNGERINWELIFSDLGTSVVDPPRNIETVRDIDTTKRCLIVEYDMAHTEKLKVTKVDCTTAAAHETVCKIGSFTNNCQKNKDHQCCYSPTANYYIKNQQAGPGSSLADAEANCFIEIDQAPTTVIQDCKTVLKTLEPAVPDMGNTELKIPFRIGSSYFYFADEDCIGKQKRKAVISNRKVHEFISRYLTMANLEAADTYTSAIFGLRYKGSIHKMFWQNGRPHDYYNETYWNGDRPHFDDLGDTEAATEVCGAYKESPLEFEYRWELSTTCAAAGTDINVCELPIRVTDLMPTAKKLDCGMRHRRGVLARSSYAAGHELQALYGEFPWHAAIYRVRHHVGLVSAFVCSGVLIDKEFVVTAAHCVVGPSNSYSIVLGEYTVGGGSTVLERQVVGVSDILVYPGYESTNPLTHDIALVQLDRAIQVDDYPQIGVACLPFPDILYRNTGAWDCFTVGWNGKSGAMQKVESNILPTRLCKIHTRPYYDFIEHTSQKHYGRGNAGYDKAHGYHLVTYPKHFYFNRRQPDLVCTAPHESEACVDDSAAVLVCRRAPVFEDEFFSNNRGYGYPGYQKPIARIVNAYGKYRFDSDKWYVMGLAHSLTPCGAGSKGYGRGYRQPKKNLQVFTPVSEYLSFIHAHQDAKTSAN